MFILKDFAKLCKDASCEDVYSYTPHEFKTNVRQVKALKSEIVAVRTSDRISFSSLTTNSPVNRFQLKYEWTSLESVHFELEPTERPSLVASLNSNGSLQVLDLKKCNSKYFILNNESISRSDKWRYFQWVDTNNFMVGDENCIELIDPRENNHFNVFYNAISSDQKLNGFHSISSNYCVLSSNSHFLLYDHRMNASPCFSWPSPLLQTADNRPHKSCLFQTQQLSYDLFQFFCWSPEASVAAALQSPLRSYAFNVADGSFTSLLNPPFTHHSIPSLQLCGILIRNSEVLQSFDVFQLFGKKPQIYMESFSDHFSPLSNSIFSLESSPLAPYEVQPTFKENIINHEDKTNLSELFKPLLSKSLKNLPALDFIPISYKFESSNEQYSNDINTLLNKWSCRDESLNVDTLKINAGGVEKPEEVIRVSESNQINGSQAVIASASQKPILKRRKGF